MSVVNTSTKFRKKPVVIDAVQFGYNEWADKWMKWRIEEIPAWLHEAFDNGTVIFEFGDEDYWYFVVDTIEGKMRGGPDDWLIRGIEGELYPCKHSIFDATYEAVTMQKKSARELDPGYCDEATDSSHSSSHGLG